MPLDALVVGAGAAGIAAARALRAAGARVLLLEAASRPGGRAVTDTRALGAPFDLGATWLHQADDNPLTPHAGPALDHDTVRERHLRLPGRWATPAELRAHEAAADAFDAALAAPHPGPDVPVSAVVPHGGPWDATVAHWWGNQINGAPLDAISRADYLATDLDGPNLLPEGGLGAILARLAEGLPLRLDAPVAALRRDGAAVVAEGPWGAARAGAAIVTVSTGVLAAGAPRFDPALPEETRAAVAGLPLGLLLKLGFALPEPGAIPLPPFHSARHAVTAATPHPFGWIALPFGRGHLFGFVGGARAWELSRAGPAALEEAARADLHAMFGPVPLGPMVTHDWGRDPLFRGSYSHARPGHRDSRAVLARPLWDGALHLAGEAAHARFAGTVAGAWLSGEAAARAVLNR